MSMAIDWQIPPSILRWLDAVPAERPVALLLRHSVRDYLPPGDAGYTLPITEVGERLGRELGARLGARLRGLRASPLLRCVQTAEALAAGAGVELPIRTDRLLGDPGVYVLDDQRAWQNWQARGHEGVMAHLVAERDALPGMAQPEAAARFLVHHMLAHSTEPGVHVFVTHDSLVTATAARLLARPLGKLDWPWYLEGGFFWREPDGLHAAYREHHQVCTREPLCALDEANVLELARREVAQTVGLDSGARFFLAGGAYKTLLTGRPPRDLDLWAPSAADRGALVAALLARGAQRLPERPFAEAFAIADRVVEVPTRTGYATLGELLAAFDLALSAIGVEHAPGDRWSTKIHPLAQRSVQARQVLLLKPLINWKYALTTLERLRRYATELGFAVPPEEESAIWSVFDAQPHPMRAGMLERYARTGAGGFRVAEEAACRFP